MAKKNITIDDLAVMVQKGFADTATKDELKSMRIEMNRRFDWLEDRVLASHQKRIEKLEAEVKELREMFAV